MTSMLAILLLLLGSVACGVSGQVCFKLGIGCEAEGLGVPSLRRWIGSGTIVVGGVLAADRNPDWVERQ